MTVKIRKASPMFGYSLNRCQRLLLAAAVAIAQLAAAGPQRVFVEPFTTKAGPEKLREQVEAELRKSPALRLTNSESSANLILGGGGEIWIKGYRSLNPRSGTSPANGTPVYGGYLSVELRDAQGETLWSDLVTPSPDSQDVGKDLSRSIARHLTAALPGLAAAATSNPPARPALTIHGAGATFPQPVYDKWFKNYRRENPNLQITYDSIGSEAGVRQLLAREIDFGASDSPQAIHDLAPGREADYLFFPSVAGAVVPVYNIPGFTGNLTFTAEALAGIYSGKIKKWSDPLLRQANRGAHLPDLDIVVIHRSDGSGTSYAFTEFLSQNDPAWKASLAPQWPTGRGAAGNGGVAKLVKELGGSIGYVEFIYALQNHLNPGNVRNREGESVAASLESIAAAAQSAKGLKQSIVNAPGAGAYPIATFTWLVIPVHMEDRVKRSELAGFLQWMVGPGQRQAAALGYLALPKELIARETAAIEKLR